MTGGYKGVNHVTYFGNCVTRFRPEVTTLHRENFFTIKT